MSGIYIPGMEVPKACVYRKNGQLVTCPLYDIDGYCGALKSEASHKEDDMPSNCPLVPVPEHGRTIDADALIAWFEEWYDPNADLEICHVIDILDDNSVTPTIIPADKEAEK